MPVDCSNDSIAVVYLARGLPGGLDVVRSFFSSYEAHKPGVRHSLRVLVKGWETVPGLDTVTALAGRLGARVIPLPDDGFDLGAYFRVVPGVTEQWICFLNTNSRICAPNWLSLLFQGASLQNVGAAGATGSWESTVRTSWLAKYSGGVRRAPRGIARAAYNWLQFPNFPNLHLRSTAIITQTSLFREFATSHRIPESKRHAHILESGRTGFSAFLRRRGLDLIVCGANGVFYSPNEWPASATYRSLGQHNLLIADRQTAQYETESNATRRLLQMAAWGESIDDQGASDRG